METWAAGCLPLPWRVTASTDTGSHPKPHGIGMEPTIRLRHIIRE